MAAAHSGDCKTYMYSHSYSYAWGCRCCVTGAQYQVHGLWDVYTNAPACTPSGTFIYSNTDQCCSGAAAFVMAGVFRCS